MQMRVLAFVLAGGKGTRLSPLTKERAKPAVRFGGSNISILELDAFLQCYIDQGGIVPRQGVE